MTVTEIAGRTLLHFVWQGALIAGAVQLLLWLARHRAPATRYAITCAALLTMLAMPIATGVRLADRSSRTTPPSAGASATVAVVADQSGSQASEGRVPVGAARFAQTAASAPITLNLIVWLWAVGVALLTLRMAVGWWRIHRVHQQALATPPSRWQSIGERLAAQLGIRAAMHVAECSSINTPAVVGWLRPVVILPLASLAGLSPMQVEAILAHELAHIRRHDYLINLVQGVAEILLFYHPAVWWVSARMRAEREHCCDEVAVQICGNRAIYADALIRLEAQRLSRQLPLPAATGGPLAMRVKRILQVRNENTTPWPIAVLAVGLAIALQAARGFAEPQPPIVGTPRATIADTWSIYATDHIEIYYRPADLSRVDGIASAAEAAYAQVRTALRHDLSFKVPVITMTAAEVDPIVSQKSGFVPQSFGYPRFGPEFDTPAQRMVVPVDLLEAQPRLIAHEMTHMFMFDIIPLQRWSEGVPAWLPEGLAEYVAGIWTTAASDTVRSSLVRNAFLPSELDVRFPRPMDEEMRHLGHAVVDFIDHEFGQAGLRRFLMALRSPSAPGGPTPYETAFGLKANEFDRDFARFMRERFAR